MNLTAALGYFILFAKAGALPQLVMPSLNDPPSSHTSAECRDMVAAVESCSEEIPFLNDEAAMKRCVCSKDSFTADIVTMCTGDTKTYEDLCGDGDVDRNV